MSFLWGNMMQKILVSRCLLGEAVRYDGETKGLEHALLQRWQQEGRVVPFCPEVAGGLPVPRPPAELQPDGRVHTRQGEDVTSAFVLGAERALALCLREGVAYALLKERSPSCGSHWIYDGRFQGKLEPGEGMTAMLLRQQGIPVYSEEQLEELARVIASES